MKEFLKSIEPLFTFIIERINDIKNIDLPTPNLKIIGSVFAIAILIIRLSPKIVKILKK